MEEGSLLFFPGKLLKYLVIALGRASIFFLLHGPLHDAKDMGLGSGHFLAL